MDIPKGLEEIPIGMYLVFDGTVVWVFSIVTCLLFWLVHMITEEIETENMIALVVEVAMTRVLDGTIPTPLGKIGLILKTCLPSARTFTRSTRTLQVVHRYGPPRVYG